MVGEPYVDPWSLEVSHSGRGVDQRGVVQP